MKKVLKVFAIFITTGIIMLGLLYAGLAYYYKDTYLYGTYINGVYCTGLTPDEAQKELNRATDRGVIKIISTAGEYTIDPSSINYTYDFGIPLKTYKYSQNPLLWIFMTGEDDRHVQITPLVSFDESMLRNEMVAMGLENINAPFVCKLISDENGYRLADNKAVMYSLDKCLKKASDVLSEGGMAVDLADDCYANPVYNDAERKAMKIMDLLDEYHKRVVRIRIEDDIVELDDPDMDGMLLKDDEGFPLLTDDDMSLIVDKESVCVGMEDALAQYNSYNNHYFTTHDGRVVHLTQGTLGNSIDMDGLAENVYTELESGKSGPVEVVCDYKHKMNDDEADYASKIGDTYIEISLDEQHMFYYEKGELKLDTGVVTGKVSSGSGTKEGVYYVYYMQRNRTLIGETYRSFVKYWMAFNRHVGIHDASWRTNWSEDAYLRSGSHGCVNTPEEKAKELYESIEVGIPVIVYSYENSLSE